MGSLKWSSSSPLFFNTCHFLKPVYSKTIFLKVFLINAVLLDFPGGTVVKNPPANAGDTGSSPGPGRSHMP